MGAVRQGRSKASALYPFGGKENGANQDRAWRRHLLKSMIFMDQVDSPRTRIEPYTLDVHAPFPALHESVHGTVSPS
jgi:hypothetical protein